MPRRFALALLALLVLLLAGLVLGRRVHEARQKRKVAAQPTPTRTIPPPPTPIPARLVAIWFESAADELFHPEAREVPAALDDVAFLRSLGAAVLAGPRDPELLPPFPAGWTLRAAYRLPGGLAVLDLAPPAPPTPTPEPSPGDGKTKGTPKAEEETPAPTPAEPPKRWEAGSSEEVGAVQSLVLTVTKNLPSVSRVILLVGGEPVETLAGHVDLTHPLLPDLSRAPDETPRIPPMPTPPPSPSPAGAAAKAPAPGAPAGTTAPAPGPASAPPAAVPAPKKAPSALPAPRPAARPTPRPAQNTLTT